MAIWPSKKDPGEDHVDREAPHDRESPGSGKAGPLHELTARLGQLGQLLEQTNRQVVEYLIHRESQASAGEAGFSQEGPINALREKIDAVAEKLDRAVAAVTAGNASGDASSGKPAGEETLNSILRPLLEKLDAVDSKLASLVGKASGGAEDSLRPALAQLGDGIRQQIAALGEGIGRMQGSLDAGLQNLAQWLRPAEPVSPQQPDAQPASDSDWQRIIFGAELAEHPGLDSQRQQLLGGLMEGDPGACSLIGQLLVFRSAMTEKLPPLLKEIGEAYYRWQPKTRPDSPRNDPLEQVLVDWLKETMHEAGIANTIELAHPGQRFDSTRHTAATRGVEITEVRGWIVLRDNGKVYAKASVVVK